MGSPIAWYREFLPCPALQAEVYVLFSFVPEPAPARPRRPVLREMAFDEAPLCAPQFADGHVSLSFELGQMCAADGRWYVDSQAPRGTVIGPLTAVGRIERCDLPSTVGAFLRPAGAAPLLRVPLSDLENRSVAIDDLWGAASSRLPAALCELDEEARLDRLESVLLTQAARGRRRTGAFGADRLAAAIIRRRGGWRVGDMAHAAGVSRQCLSREFRERIGIPPKLYARLARFQSGLVHAGSRASVDWAQAAIELGYADQSHMIAEFREFSGLTPQMLASRDWFHPFIVRAKSDGAR